MVGRAASSLAMAIVMALTMTGCQDPSSTEPSRVDEDATDTDAGDGGDLSIEPLDDDAPGGDAQSPWEPAPRACDPELWSSGWAPLSEAPVLQARAGWESAGLRPAQFVDDGDARQAWYVGQTLEHCSVGGWAATCLVGRVGRANAPSDGGLEGWAFADGVPAMDLWHWGLSVRRLFVQSPAQSSANRWDAWLAIEGVDVDSRIYWASSDDGDRWTVRVSEPALGPGYDAWDEGGVSDPVVWTRNGGTSMLYTGFGGDLDRPQIGLALLTDQGFTRLSSEPVLAHGEGGRHDAWGVLRPSLLVFEDCLVMFHQAIDEQGTSTIGVATSRDGTSWARAEHPLEISGGFATWHDAGEYDPVVYAEGDEVYLLYRGAARSDPGGVGWLVLP